MSNPPKKRGPKYLYNDGSNNPKVLLAEKEKIEAQLKQLEDDDVYLGDQYLLVLQQIKEILDKIGDA